MTTAKLRVTIPQQVYSKHAGDRVVVINMLSLRTTPLDDIASTLWRYLESQPQCITSLTDLVNAYAPKGGAAAELAVQRIQQLAQARLLEVRES
jgi:hypothetical protein